MRPATLILGLAACLVFVPISGARDKRIPANKDPNVTNLPSFPTRFNRGGGDAVGSGRYMQSEPSDLPFMACTDDPRAANYGKLRLRIVGFTPNENGCWYRCDAPDAVNAGKVDQDYFPCLFTCTDPAALNYSSGPYEYRISCIYSVTPPP